METGLVAVAAITVICYLLATLLKQTKLDDKWLPGLCGVLGGVLGVVGYKIMADFPAQDLLTAVAVGIVSGLAATGANQVVKQMSKNAKK